MKQTRLMMDMPITVDVVDPIAGDIFNEVFDYFTYIDNTFSVYKENSEITKINKRKLKQTEYSPDMKEVFALCQKTTDQTNGYFDIQRNGIFDPSGLVKGWAIWNAATILKKGGAMNFYVDAGGDIQVSGTNAKHKKWEIGIRNPFNTKEIVKIVLIEDKGVATSGTYERGLHIYDPHNNQKPVTDIVSLTVVGPDVYEADRFATAAFAMGRKGIAFIGTLKGFEGYMIDTKGIATYTKGFHTYIK